MQWAPILWLPPEQQEALGQHPCFFTQHSGVSDVREPVAEDIPNGATITVASRAMNASFFMMRFLFTRALRNLSFDRNF
jgi:hypothetical protein